MDVMLSEHIDNRRCSCVIFVNVDTEDIMHPDPTLLPLSPIHAAALMHFADLRAEAERERLARQVARAQRGSAWPAAVATALRDRIRAALPGTRPERHGAACVTC
jgi:hypothetical protein